METNIAALRHYYQKIAPFVGYELGYHEDLRFWQQLASAYTGQSVLELGVGNGRVTQIFAPFAKKLIGLDIVPEMIILARQNLYRHDQVSLMVADMCHIPIRQTFDLIIAANDPFCHLLTDLDQERALQAVSSHLNEQGCFILSSKWLSPSLLAQGQGQSNFQVSLGTTSIQGKVFWQVDQEKHLCQDRWEYYLPNQPPVVVECLSRYWTVESLNTQFKKNGLKIINYWGDDQGSSFNEQTSSSLFIKATKL